MNDNMPVLHALHMSKICQFLDQCHPEFTVIMDGTPCFAEAECVMIRVVHKRTGRIHEFVIHLGLYSESLDGATIAEHVSETLTRSDTEEVRGLGLKLKHWKCTAIDRAGTNKRAMDIVEEDHGVSPFSAFCVSHGTAGCGKKGGMTIGKEVVKHLTSMVKFSLCKARVVFARVFKERARKTGSSPRWGVYHEMCEQINRIGLGNLRDDYVSVCAENNWSPSGANKFLAEIEEVHDFCVASVEIAALVDVGHPHVSETYICESKQPGAFTVWEGITKLRILYARGINSFNDGDMFVELKKRAEEAAAAMEESHLVSWFRFTCGMIFIYYFSLLCYVLILLHNRIPCRLRLTLPMHHCSVRDRVKQLHKQLWIAGYIASLLHRNSHSVLADVMPQPVQTMQLWLADLRLHFHQTTS